MYKFTIHGARGTLPVSGRSFFSYGGATSCFSLRNGKRIIIIDAGTGIVDLGAQIELEGNSPPITLLFTHFHMDHVIGLPSFAPVYNAKSHIAILGDSGRYDQWKKTLRGFMSKPYWPVGLGEVAATMKLKDLPARKGYIEIDDIRISWMNVPHPQQCLSYRLDWTDNSVVVATDCEYTPSTIDDNFVDFCAGANHLIFDAHYTTTEYKKHVGWGHSTWATGVSLVKKANIKHLVLSHHAPERTDKEIDSIVAEARSRFPSTSGAREGTILRPWS